MNHIATFAAAILGLCAMTAAHKALNRADESDRRAHALELRINYLEGALTNEQRIGIEMRQIEVNQ